MKKQQRKSQAISDKHSSTDTVILCTILPVTLAQKEVTHTDTHKCNRLFEVPLNCKLNAHLLHNRLTHGVAMI